ncbi:hypothetical protein RBU60_08140 [Mesonia sp. MT50]|uniref:Lipocalin-like domain-containing protein n=1 Tax=Mesonia profundi TaxID=3070998 RepID=A0ABU1A2Q6_9FLAO|nr:hypothetical protein [Mesonia profundi]MDQ7917541.1 hypothetical protein [Mesonia profundi]
MKTTLKFASLLLLSLFVSCSSDDDSGEQTPSELDQIQGEWIRVGGNNPANNGMVINVNDNSGVVVTPAPAQPTGFTEGEVKWKEIVLQDGTHYRYEELGSNGSYYPASLRFGVDDTLRISVDAAPGDGYIQKWVR